MKKIAIVAAIVAVTATAGFAGGLEAPVMEEVVIVEEAAASSAGELVVPLILFFLLAGVFASGSTGTSTPPVGG